MLLSAATALSALAPTGDGPRSVLADPAHAAPAAPSPVDIDRPVAARTGTDPAAAVPAVRPAAGAEVRPRPAVTTMSFDAPIQGGLTAHEAQAASTALIGSHAAAGIADAGAQWTPAMGRTALARAQSWLGMPYSWAGGDSSGPTTGRCDAANGADLDCHIVGFDCSGLTTYAWGAYTALPHFAQTQRDAGQFHPSVEQLRAGDLVFFSGYLPGGIGHVAIYEGDGMVIEAPQSGAVVRRSALTDLMAHDGTYRGAVRPLTPATPTLAATAVVPRHGGTVTLRGRHLSGVTSVTVAGRTQRVASRSDSAIRVDVPRASSGRTVTVTVTTSWGATSAPVTLTYAAPAATRPVTHTPATPTQTVPTPVRTSPTTPVKPTPAKPTPAKPTPAEPTPSPVSSTTAPTQPVPAPVEPSGSELPGP